VRAGGGVLTRSGASTGPELQALAPRISQWIDRHMERGIPRPARSGIGIDLGIKDFAATEGTSIISRLRVLA
jgi:hypothetical protein